MFRSAQIKITLLNVNSSILSLSILFFISFTKKKQTNKQIERTLVGTPQQLWPITVGQDTNKKNKNFYFLNIYNIIIIIIVYTWAKGLQNSCGHVW